MMTQGNAVMQWICISVEEHQASEAPVFYNESQATLPELCSRTRCYFYYSDQKTGLSAPQKETLSLLPQLFAM